MKFSPTSLIHGQTVKFPQLIQSKMADTSSLQSNRSLILSYNLRTAQEAICLIYLASWFEYWQTEKLYRTIAVRARQMNYNGKWETVQRLLEERITNPEEFYDAFLSTGHSAEEFWGNVIFTSRRIEFGLKYTDPFRTDTRKVTRIQRHRGYRDKGTYRFPHERHGIPPYSDQEREDRMKFVKHPLLNEEISINNEEYFLANLGKVPDTTAGKEEFS